MSSMLDKLYEMYLEDECSKPDSEEIKSSIYEYEQVAKNAVAGELEMELWDSVCSYGQSRERKGFQSGFKMAWQMLTELWSIDGSKEVQAGRR